MKKIIVLISFLFVSIVLFAQENFRYTHKSSYNSIGIYGIETSDSCYVTVGNIDKFIKIDTIIGECYDCEEQIDTAIYDLITSDIIVIKTDIKGDTIWTTQIGNDGNEWSNYILETRDKGYIVCAVDSNYNGNVIKLDFSGKIIWKSILVSHYPQKIFDFDSYYIVLGTRSYLTYGNDDIYAQAIDKSGNVIWNKCFGESGLDPNLTGAFNEEFKSACLGTNNNIFIVGERQNNIIYFDIDYNGNLLTKGKLNGANVESARDIIAVENNNYVILYNYAKIPVFNMQPRLVKINSLGEKLWEKGYFDYTYYDIGTHIEKTKDNGIIISGQLNSNLTETDTLFILKTDINGKPSWLKTFDYYSSDYIQPNSIIETYDNHYFLVGTNNAQKLTLIKTSDENSTSDVSFNEITKINIISTNKPFSIYPNPAQEFITIKLDELQCGNFEILDLYGNVVSSFLLSDKEKRIKLNGLKNGVYLIRMTTKNQTFSDKLIITNR